VDRRSRLAGVVVIGLTVLALAVAAPRVTSQMADFEVYWTAAVRARAAEPLYRVEDGHYQFKYLPAFAVLAIPAGTLPLQTAKGVWFRVSVVLLVALVALSIRAVPARLRPPGVVAVAIVVSMAKFYGHELVLGQVNLLFAVVVVLALRAMTAGREAAAGALLALAVVVKPYAVLFGPWLAARRQARSAAVFTLGLVAAALLPAAVYGIDGAVALHRDWWITVTTSTAPNLTNPDNVSIAGMYAKWLGDAPLVGPLVAGTSLLLLTAAALAFARRAALPEPHVLEGALLLTLVPLLSPQGWDYVFLVATPAVALLANHDRGLPAAMRVLTGIAGLVIGLSLYDVMGRAAYGAFMRLSVITVCFLVVVSALVVLRWRRVV
jgi:hypothetical protein